MNICSSVRVGAPKETFLSIENFNLSSFTFDYIECNKSDLLRFCFHSCFSSSAGDFKCTFFRRGSIQFLMNFSIDSIVLTYFVFSFILFDVFWLLWSIVFPSSFPFHRLFFLKGFHIMGFWCRRLSWKVCNRICLPLKVTGWLLFFLALSFE